MMAQKTQSADNLDNLREVSSYTHDEDKRPNNPRAGLASHDDQADKIHTYAFDVHSSPTLDWAGKAENTSFDVPTSSIHIHETVIPLRVINRFQRVRAETAASASQQVRQLSLFPELDPVQRILEQQRAIESYQHLDNWKNRLIAGDSLVIMNSLLQKEGMAGKVQMAYIDPPYGIKYGSNFQPFVNKRDVKDKNDDDLSAEPETIKAFRDTWELGIHSYLNYLRNRLLLTRELLTDSGSVFVQISDENVHLVRCLCDEVFGVENFVSLITFKKTSPLGSKGLAGICDYIIWYAKDKSQIKYRELYEPKDAGNGTLYTWLELKDGTRRKMTDEEKKSPKNYPTGAHPFQPDTLVSAGYTQTCMYDFEFEGKIYSCGKKSWKTNREGMQHLIEVGRLIVPKDTPRYVRYYDDFTVQPINNLWDDTGGATDMRYVVQTSTKVISRCMLMTTDPNGLVLDITCGSGTTAYVAEQWGRRWITCDTSRVAIAIARQRLLTANYDYYKLADEKKGISGGFVYKTVPHVTLKSIANDEKPDEETLYDQPVIDRKKIRVAGPFNVEALPAPVVFSPDEAIMSGELEQSGQGKASLQNEAAKHSDWSEQMKAAGITGTNGQKMKFSSIELFSGTQWINAEAYTESAVDTVETPRHAFISFANEYSLMDTRRVYGTYQEAMKFPHDMIIFAAFQFDPAATEMINELRKRSDKTELLMVNMNTDLMTQDLRKKMRTDSLFWFVGQPDVLLVPAPQEENDHGRENAEKSGEKYRVKVLGFDYYNVNAGKVESGNTDKIAMWLLDTDYNGMELNPTQIFFPMEGKSGGWNKLAKTLKAEIDQDLMEAFMGTESLEFEAKPDQKIAVKIIDDRGIESMRVLTVEEAQ